MGPVGLDIRRWSGDVTDTSDPVTIIVDENPSITATFNILPLTVSGTYVLEPDGNTPVVSVHVQSNDSNVNAITDVNGFYVVTVPYNWSGTTILIKEGYTFEPNGISYSNIVVNEVNDYVATLRTFEISGHVFEQDSNALLSDVNVCAANGGGQWTSRYGGGSDITDSTATIESWSIVTGRAK